MRGAVTARASALLPALIVAFVVAANLPYLSFDLLWHDDGQWYFRATEGTVLAQDWRGRVTALSPYLDVLYSYGMVKLGLPLTRGLFVLVMALGSVLLYRFYRRELGLGWAVAAFAAAVPNLLPSLRGIPVGLNASYAMWGLAPLVASLLLMSGAIRHSGWRSYRAWLAAFGLFYLGLNLPGQPSSNFLIPNVLLFFALMLPQRPIKVVVYGLPFLAYSIWSLYKQVAFGHRSPELLPVASIVERVGDFLQMAGFLPFNTAASLPITAALMLVGLLGLAAGADVARRPDHVRVSPLTFRAFLAAWILCWLVCNSVAYVAASAQFRAFDYAYVFNFGAVLLQAIGLAALAAGVARVFRATGWARGGVAAVTLAGCLLFAAAERVYYADHPWGWKKYRSEMSQQLRQRLAGRFFPYGAQVLLLGDFPGVSYYGQKQANSGYLRYLLNRRDLYALIGSEEFPANVFGPWRGWFTPMRDFDADRPVVALQQQRNGSLKRVSYLLTVEADEATGLPRLRWKLFDVSSNADAPREVSSGLGLDTYHAAIADRFAGLPPPIAFAPPPDHDRLLSAAAARQLATGDGALDQPMRVGTDIVLSDVFVEPAAGGVGTKLQLLLRVEHKPRGRFRLAYVLDGRPQRVSLWQYVQSGDHLLLTTPAVARGKRTVKLGFADAGAFPPAPLPLRSPAFGPADEVVIHLYGSPGA